nr:hypothetical protein [Tanacetum cinerariifolium]
MEILSRLKDVEMMMMKTKNPPLDQTRGPREKELEKSMSQLVHQRRRLLSQPTRLKKGPSLKQAKLPTPDWDWNKTLPAIHGPFQPWISTSAQKEDPRESFNELVDTPLDFSAFVLNRLNVDTLTPELLADPTFELMKGSCKSLVELEYFFEEVYKATTNQLDWNNPEGQQYSNDLRKPLPWIPNSRGHQVIPFDHFINNDLAYLSSGVSSRTYATSVTKTKAADYGHIKWIEDLVPNTMWSQVPIIYNKHALWDISHWGRKHQQFYGYAVNRQFARDVYSKNRIIAIKKLTIIEWHSYKHLKWITVHIDDKPYTFKEGNYNRLHLQDIKDMLLLLVQGKQTNLNIEERLALGVESYQKKLNHIKPNMYISDLKHKTPYTVYSNPKGFIYHNQDKKNRLMRVDKLHKFSDGTLNNVWSALDDTLKKIRMKYPPQTIWREVHKERAGTIIKDNIKWTQCTLPLACTTITMHMDCDGTPKRLTMYLNLWSHKVVRHRYSNPMIQSELEGSTQGYPL